MSDDRASDAVQDCAQRLKVLSDPTRLSVVRLLMEKPLTVSQLNETLQVEPTLLSHHLKVLRDAGLVESERSGKSVIYRLGPENARRRRALDLGCCELSLGDIDAN
ncbi:MAG: metalloregulator ArsR/SmtB family transcription factor [Planctomycetota bacterium]